MADFIYQEPFPVGEDKTKYRLLTKEYVKVVECDGRKILKVDPKGLELLSKEAYADVSFYLRAAHLQKLRNILDDPEATDNDKFVAYTMLLNQVVAAEGELPTCQDTGTAICIGHKGEDVWTGADDAECIARGVYETYKDRNLRYSQVVPFTMTEEKNSGTNLPAQIDIYGGHPGMEYEFLFITKGGGSANKTFLYQQTKALLNEESLTKFIQQHIFDLGTSACPPYHLAICIGGTSAEMCLSTVKKASAAYLDELPTSGNEGGRCFRDLEWEEKVLKICRESGVGAQFGGKYLVHDVRVIRAPRHAASCPVAIGVSCSADRNIKAKITPEGIEVLSPAAEKMRLCAFLWTYYGYPNSNYEGKNVEVMRYRNGEIMARKEMEAGTMPDVDFVAGVPDSGLPHAIGYANESGKKFARPFIKYTPTWSRSFMPANQQIRNQVAKMKQIPVPELIKDKKLLLIDDSIVRGTQLRETVDFLYKSGAKEVHMRSACPPIMYSCKYLNFSRGNSDMELLARRVIQELEGDEGHKHLAEYADAKTERGQCMLKSICDKMGFDSLGFQSVEGLIEAIGLDPEKLCTYCWTGKE